MVISTRRKVFIDDDFIPRSFWGLFDKTRREATRLSGPSYPKYISYCCNNVLHRLYGKSRKNITWSVNDKFLLKFKGSFLW